MPSVEGAGVELAVTQRGIDPAHPAVLLIHGMASDAAALEPTMTALAREAGVIAYDRRGYGSSGAPEPYHGTTVEEQAEDAAAVLRALDAGPAIVCGEDLGALIALDLVKRHRSLVRAVVLLDPPLFMFVPDATERLAAQRAELETALRARGPQAGIEVWLQGVEGERVDRAKAAHAAFFADYAGLASWPVTRRELRALDVPAVVLTRPEAERHVVAAADALAALLPTARRAHDGDVVVATRALLGAAPSPDDAP